MRAITNFTVAQQPRDDWPDLPINEATIEQHYVAPMPPVAEGLRAF